MKIRKLFLIILALSALMLLCTANAFAETLINGYDNSMLSMNNISTGIEHTVAILADGTAVAVGHDEAGQSDVSLWDDVVIVRAGPCVTFGIRSDGSTMSVGYNTYGPYGKEWDTLKDIAVYRFHVVGLCPDGTVVACGENAKGQCNTSSWSNIKAIGAGGWHTVGLQEDGTVVAVGDNRFGQCNVQSWENIVAIAAGGVHTLGLTADGRVLATGDNEYGQCDVNNWTDIIAISAGFAHSVGIKAEGTVVAVGQNETGACDVGSWRDVVAVATNNENTVGLTKDGTMLAAGSNNFGQNDFEEWKNIKIGDDMPHVETDSARRLPSKAADINGPWIYYEDSRTLIIHDESAMKDYTAEGSFDAPWAFLSGYVDNILIEPGIKRISDWPFLCLTTFNIGDGVKTIYIPKSVTSIGEGAFEFSLELTDVFYEGSEEEWASLIGDKEIKILENKAIHCLSEGSQQQGSHSPKAEPSPETETNPFQNKNAGDTVTFGRYEQDNNRNNGPEDISWIVLENNRDRLLAVSEYALDCIPYHSRYVKIDWENCDLRRWLNETFVNTAFSAGEQSLILNASVSADKNPEEEKSNPGNITHDQVFLLSIKEIADYFNSDYARFCKPTAYAIEQGCKVYPDIKTCWWWTRTPGCDNYYVTDVRGDGTFNYIGSDADRDFLCVRPAIWINLSTPSKKTAPHVGPESSRKTISAGGSLAAGLCEDGTVVAAGSNFYGQTDLSDWRDIVDVSVIASLAMGVRADGTVLVKGYQNGQENVSGWTNIAAVSAGIYHTAGLRFDGTVIADGDNTYGQCNTSEWKNIVAVATGVEHTVGLRADGTVVATGNNSSGECNVSGWRDIVAVSAAYKSTIGLRADGTVVATGSNEDGKCDVSAWRDIVAVSAGGTYTLGLHSDGTVEAVGNNEYGQCNVSDWRDITAIAAGGTFTVGLRADGTAVATGSGQFGQTDVSGWRNIKQP